MTARAQKEYMDYCMLKQACIDHGKAEGYKQGVEAGEERAKLEAARNFLMENAPEDMIARCTGLSLETVQQLANELKIKA